MAAEVPAALLVAAEVVLVTLSVVDLLVVVAVVV